jgi:hypothetical protein
MRTPDFYKLIDQEISALLVKYKNDAYLLKHKQLNNQKSYAFLIWFLETYGGLANYADFITDGDNDSSCDIVFDKTDNQNKKVFYIVQSKWSEEKNIGKDKSRGEITKALSDFETILRGDKQDVNDRLKTKLVELDAHRKANGEVKFIFLTLAEYQGGADENIESFKNQDDTIDFEIIDIERIKNDYIERNYKKIKPQNPLATYYNPEKNPVTLRIERLEDSNNENFIKIERPFEAYVFLLRPKMIFELFEKYGFALFYKNVRNPLLESQFNEEIKQTAEDNPAFFWYYNNGITAITYLLPKLGKSAEQIELAGLQVINGAQTVYAIYRAYKEADALTRQKMDTEALVTLRLLKSAGTDFDLNVTRYTNSQNPIRDRDFYANDDIQLQLQQASFKTNVWYEKRKDEFRNLPDGVTKVSNEEFAKAYLAYELQEPVATLAGGKVGSKDLNFISHKDDKDGRYEKVFGVQPKFEDMLCAYYIFDVIKGNVKSLNDRDSDIFVHWLLSFFKTIFTKYIIIKHGSTSININRYIIEKLFQKADVDIIYKIMIFINNHLNIQVNSLGDRKVALEKMLSSSFHGKLKEDVEELEINPEDIESIDLTRQYDVFDVSGLV